MNVLYILGNGFDLAQGMKTSYSDFYRYLTCWRLLRCPEIRKMKRAINKDKALWSDMEEALGQYTDRFDDVELFRNSYLKLSDLLQDYLKREENDFRYHGWGIVYHHKGKVMRDLLHPSEYLLESEKRRFESLCQSLSCDGSMVNISVMTLNYTHTFETLLDFHNSPIKLLDGSGNSGMLNDVIHVHGEVDDTIIIGVDDKEQISNKTFRDDSNINDLMIKKESIRSMRTLAEEKCKALITEADLIILFGVSLGKTDSQWWKLIGEEIKKRNVIILQFLYSSLIKGDLAKRKTLINTIERQEIKDFKKKFELENTVDEKSIRRRLFFIVNSFMFAPLP